MKNKLRFLFLTLIAGSFPALAHPGHGTFDGINLMHYFTSPIHASMFAILLCIVLYLSVLKKTQRR